MGKIVLETGLMNCVLKGTTVILDIVESETKRVKSYHHYKTREKAEYMWQVFGKEAINMYIEE